MKKILCLFIVFGMLGSGAVLAQEPPKEPPKDDEYLAMVSKAMRDPTEVSWAAMRRLYAETSFYKPFGGATVWPAFYAAGKTAAASKMPEAQQAFKDMQKQHYANFTSHVYSIKIAKEISSDVIDPAQEQQALEAIADSIVENVDGSAGKPYKIVTPDEEKLVIETYLGGTIKSKQPSTSGGHSVDIVTYSDPHAPKPLTVYFNTDVITAHAGK